MGRKNHMEIMIKNDKNVATINEMKRTQIRNETLILILIENKNKNIM